MAVRKPLRLEDITGDGARVDDSAVVPPEDAAEMLAELKGEHDPARVIGPEGMRVVWISGPLGCCVHLDTPDAGTTLDFGRGMLVRDWPGSRTGDPTEQAWTRHLPEATPWNPGWRGILTEIDGAVLYEYVSEDTGERIATWHCTLCHKPGEASYVNEDANVRRGLRLDAERHLKDGHDPMPKEMRDAIDAAAAERGMHIPHDWCASCRLVADLRASA